MYMVDEDKYLNDTFGFTNKDGDIESVSYDNCDEVVVIDSDCCEYRVYPQDVVKLTIELTGRPSAAKAVRLNDLL